MSEQPSNKMHLGFVLEEGCIEVKGATVSEVWTHLLIQWFLYFLLFSTLQNNGEDIKTMK